MPVPPVLLRRAVTIPAVMVFNGPQRCAADRSHGGDRARVTVPAGPLAGGAAGQLPRCLPGGRDRGADRRVHHLDPVRPAVAAGRQALPGAEFRTHRKIDRAPVRRRPPSVPPACGGPRGPPGSAGGGAWDLTRARHHPSAGTRDQAMPFFSSTACWRMRDAGRCPCSRTPSRSTRGSTCSSAGSRTASSAPARALGTARRGRSATSPQAWVSGMRWPTPDLTTWTQPPRSGTAYHSTVRFALPGGECPPAACPLTRTAVHSGCSHSGHGSMPGSATAAPRDLRKQQRFHR